MIVLAFFNKNCRSSRTSFSFRFFSSSRVCILYAARVNANTNPTHSRTYDNANCSYHISCSTVPHIIKISGISILKLN